MLVIPRFACPSCRWITTRGTPFVRHLDRVRVSVGGARTRPSQTCGHGRVTNCLRAADASQRRPAVARWIRHSIAPIGSLPRISRQGSSWSGRPAVHPDLSALAALSTPDEHSAAGTFGRRDFRLAGRPHVVRRSGHRPTLGRDRGIPTSDPAVSSEQPDRALAGLQELWSRIEAEPISRRWKLRDRVGENVRWSEEPEEISRGTPGSPTGRASQRCCMLMWRAAIL
jgi:hypothetical protein